MALFRSCLALVALAVALSACLSANVQSTFVAPYERSLDSVLLVTQFDTPGQPYEMQIAAVVSEAMEARGVTVSHQSIATSDPLPAADAASAVGASAVLAIRLGEAKVSDMGPAFGGMGASAGSSSRTELAVQLNDIDTRTVVWTAEIVAKSTNQHLNVEARTAARKLIAALDKDGLLPPTRQ